MPNVPTKKEFDAVIKQSIDKRVKYFQNTVGGHECMWVCMDDGGSLFAHYDGKGRECIALWPAKEYAELVISEENRNLLKKVNVTYFFEEYYEELKEKNMYLMIFPTFEGGALFSVEDFHAFIEEEFAKYGDVCYEVH